MSVARQKETVDDAAGMTRPFPTDDIPELLVRADVRFHKAEGAFVERRVHNLPLAGTFTVAQCHHRAKGGVKPGDAIRKRDIGTRGRTIGIARHMTQAAHRFTHHSITWPLAIRTGLPVTRYAHEHQTRIDLREHIVSKSPLFQSAGPEVLNHDIALCSEAFNEILTCRKAQVDDDQF